MNELINRPQPSHITEILNRSDIEKYHFLGKFIKKYNKKKKDYILNKKELLKENFNLIYEEEIGKSKNIDFIEELKKEKPEILNYFLNIHGIKKIKSLISNAIPISFLISTILVLFYFYFYSMTIAGVFLFFYIFMFLLLTYIISSFNINIINKLKYKKIFNLLIEDQNLDLLLGKEFDISNYLNKTDLNELKKLISKEEFIDLIKRKSLSINYDDVLMIVKKEFIEISKKIENYEINKVYDFL